MIICHFCRSAESTTEAVSFALHAFSHALKIPMNFLNIFLQFLKLYRVLKNGRDFYIALKNSSSHWPNTIIALNSFRKPVFSKM